MSYTTLYRKYRSQDFSEVIGQSHIVTTLTNQVKRGNPSHAYLFTGSRGIGKTSCAKIFARAVNCLKPIDGNPCGKCAACKSLADPSNLDVLEIDAASNNRVDEIRELRETVQYPPVSGKYKVYIIDEVHMLTDSAFNALLKTLEEPPAYVIFILATTEAHKLPATILSRCIRFDFRLVSVEELTAHLKTICEKENKQYDDDALKYIAEQAEGSVRDCLSIADMCINFSQGKLTLNDVLEVLGATDKSKIAQLFAAIGSGDIAKTLTEINELASLGKSMGLIAKELIKYARDLLVLKTCGDKLITATKENLMQMQEQAEKFSVDLFVSVIKIFSEVEQELRYSVTPRIVLESAALRTIKLFDTDLSALTERIRRLEENAKNGIPMLTNQQLVEMAKRGDFPTAAESMGIPTAVDTSELKRPMDARSIWGRMTTYFRETKKMSLYTLVGSQSDYKIEGDNLVVTVGGEKFLQFSDPAITEEIDKALLHDKVNLSLKVVKKAEGVDMDKELNKIKKLMGDAKLNISK